MIVADNNAFNAIEDLFNRKWQTDRRVSRDPGKGLICAFCKEHLKPPLVSYQHV
jgi:hypothetical protein